MQFSSVYDVPQNTKFFYSPFTPIVSINENVALGSALAYLNTTTLFITTEQKKEAESLIKAILKSDTHILGPVINTISENLMFHIINHYPETERDKFVFKIIRPRSNQNKKSRRLLEKRAQLSSQCATPLKKPKLEPSEVIEVAEIPQEPNCHTVNENWQVFVNNKNKDQSHLQDSTATSSSHVGIEPSLRDILSKGTDEQNLPQYSLYDLIGEDFLPSPDLAETIPLQTDDTPTTDVPGPALDHSQDGGDFFQQHQENTQENNQWTAEESNNSAVSDSSQPTELNTLVNSIDDLHLPSADVAVKEEYHENKIMLKMECCYEDISEDEIDETHEIREEVEVKKEDLEEHIYDPNLKMWDDLLFSTHNYGATTAIATTATAAVTTTTNNPPKKKKKSDDRFDDIFLELFGPSPSEYIVPDVMDTYT